MSRFLLVLALTAGCLHAAAASPPDPLGRENPRSAVTNFLASCDRQNYAKAAQFLDLQDVPAAARAEQGPQLAKDLESLLNSSSKFDPLQLPQDPHGSPDGVIIVATIVKEDKSYPLQLSLHVPGGIWLFSTQTVALLPKLAPLPSPESIIAARLPRFLVSIRLIGTSLWIWLGLILMGLLIASLVRLTAWLSLRFLPQERWSKFHAFLEPALLFVGAACFRISEEFVVPSAFARVFINRFLLLVIVGAVAWTVVNLVEIFLSRLDSMLSARQRAVSRSLIYLGRRTTHVVVFVFAGFFVLEGWGFQMNTFIAGLGVSGIAIALAAQQTIANVFGGVSVIGDHPILVGDFGNFGGVLGFVEDIGLRSTRIRTLSRTVVSIPNSAFAGMNLENYSIRDKMLFNPSLPLKRPTPKSQIEKAMQSIGSMLQEDRRVEVPPTPVRISALTAAAITVEIFSYVRTTDADEFYKISSELYLKIDDLLNAAGVELV